MVLALYTYCTAMSLNRTLTSQRGGFRTLVDEMRNTPGTHPEPRNDTAVIGVTYKLESKELKSCLKNMKHNTATGVVVMLRLMKRKGETFR
jgi:hypothetical protein